MHTIPGLDGDLIEPMTGILEPQLRSWHLGAILFTGFGLLALVIAAVGMYSVASYGVSQRTHEMGIRVALGARTSDIADLVIKEGVTTVVAGIAVGIGGSLLLGRFVASLLFGITPRDPSVLIGAAAVLCLLGLVACLVPAWRAARVDPATALRAE
jgi:ABC-type antimicrobial peptide transport system permease subunit